MSNPFHHLFLMLFASLVSPFALGQSYFEKVFGGYVNDRATAVVGSVDGSIVVAGTTSCFLTPGNSDDVLLLKVTSNGDLVWAKHYGIGQVGYPTAIAATPDSGVVISGSDNNGRAVVFKVDANGTVLWGRSVDTMGLYTSVAYGDSAVYLVGRGADAIIEKLDLQGNIIWTNAFGTDYADDVAAVAYTADGGAIMAGSALVGGPDADGWMVKVAADGVQEWARAYGTAGHCEEFRAVCACSGGGYLAAGDACFSDSYPYLVRVDNAGDTIWMRRIELYGGLLSSVHETGEGFLLSGWVNGEAGDIVLFEIDHDGNVLWSRVFGNDDQSIGSSTVLADGDIAITGSIVGAGPGVWDILLATSDSTGIGAECGSTSSSLTSSPAPWQVNTLGSVKPFYASSPYFVQGSSANVLFDTLCISAGFSSIEGSTHTGPTIVADLASGAIRVNDLIAGDRVDILDASGRLVRSWRMDDNGAFNIAGSQMTTGLFVVRISDAHNFPQVTRRVINLK